MRAWIEMPPGSGWADIRIATHAVRELGYGVAELRGTGNVLLRVLGAEVDVSELWRLPGQG